MRFVPDRHLERLALLVALAICGTGAACVNASRPGCQQGGCSSGLVCGVDGFCHPPQDGAPLDQRASDAVDAAGPTDAPDAADAVDAAGAGDGADKGGAKDTPVEAGAEISGEAGDTMPDAPTDLPLDVAVDAPVDVPPDAAVDAPEDAPVDLPPDLPLDLPPDFPKDGATNGVPCLDPSDCLTGNCKDGVCCNTMCTGVCKSCNQLGTVGMCVTVTDEDDPDTCSDPESSCNSGGSCRSRQGQPCSLPGGCLTGYCVDGVCCDAPCTGVCMGCTLGGTGLTTGMCGPIKPNTDPDDECFTDAASTCDQTGVCNGSGACELYPSGTLCGTTCCLDGGDPARCQSKCDGAGICVFNVTTIELCNDGLDCTSDTCAILVAGSTTECKHTSTCAIGDCCCDTMNMCVLDGIGACDAPSKCFK